MKVGDLVKWLDPWKIKRLGLIVISLPIEDAHGDYYDVLVDGKIEFCHENNMELISEGR